MQRYFEADALLKELEREEDLADDWYTAHEMYNVVKYFPTTEAVPWEFLERYADWFCGDNSPTEFVRMAKLFWESEHGDREVTEE